MSPMESPGFSRGEEVKAREAEVAAAAIRRAVTVGSFGVAGRSPREHALETARILEKLAEGSVLTAAYRRQ